MSAPFNNDNNQQQQKSLNTMKRNLTLDFNNAKRNLNLNMEPLVLSTPDIGMCKVGTPELENMILSNNGLGNASTPNPGTQILFSKNVTEEQESFSAGFVDALNNLHNVNSNSQASDSSTVYTDLEQPLTFMPVIKEEPQTVPNMNNSPPMSPVDMEFQERMKLERKRQRNRLAASKCRSRKLERISKLEDKVKHLKGENTDLASMVNQLREHVGLLKVEVMDHVQAGCQMAM